MHIVDALAAAFDPPPLAKPPERVPDGTICAMTGTPIAAGYPLRSILSDATADIASTFPYRSGSQYVSEGVARVFKSRLTGNLCCVETAAGWHGERPMVSRESAANAQRPCWSDLVRALAPGMRTVAIFSDDVQRRLWPRAAVSPVGPAWRVYLHASGISRCLTIAHADLLRILDGVERWYAAGINKDALQRGILTLAGAPAQKALGMRACLEAEREIAAYRSNNAFPVALYIAQKPAVSEMVTTTREEPTLWHSQAA
jgi:hypothetical protein